MADKPVNFLITARDRSREAFQAARRQLSGLRSEANLLRGALGAGLALAAVRGLANLTRQAIDTVDEIGKLSSAIGISAETLQEYRFAASIAGVDTDKLNTAFVQFGKRVGEARAGTGSLVEFLNKFDKGLIRAIQEARTTDKALDIVFDAMGRMTNATDRAALAAAAFGRSGVTMTNIVRDGAAGLAALRKEFRDTGAVLTNTLVADTERLNDEFTRQSLIIDNQLTKSYLELGTVGLQWKRLMAASARGAANVFDSLDATPDKLRSLQQINREIEQLGTNLIYLDQTGQTDRSEATRARIAALKEEVRLRGELAQKKSDKAVLEAGRFDDTQVKAFERAIGQARKDQERLDQQRRDAVQNQFVETAQLRELNEALAVSAEEGRRVANEIEFENAARRARIDLTTDEGKAFAASFRDAQKLRREIEKTTEAERTAARIADDLGDAVGSNLEDGIRKARTFQEAMASLGDEIARIAFRAAVTEPLGDLFKAGIKGIFAGFAAGGRPAPGEPAIVGERGPEIFVPDRAGTVIPNGAFARGSGGVFGTVNVIINNNAPAKVTARESRTANGGMNLVLTIDEVVARNMRQAGSRTRNAMEQTFGLSQLVATR